jgi:hypothetical protein
MWVDSMNISSRNFSFILLFLLFVPLIASAESSGFHIMPDGTVMRNDGAVVSPSDYHAMPDGTIMMNDGTVIGRPAGAQTVAFTSAEPIPEASAAAHQHHSHGVGAFMFQHRFMRMKMRNLLDGTNTVSASDAVLSGGNYEYMNSPTNMDMDMNMFMMMFGMTNDVTLMTMFNYVTNTMEMLGADGEYSAMKSEGLGDTTVTLMYNLNPALSLNMGVSIPTGDIDQKMTMQMGNQVMTTSMPYPMQLGSGTYDLMPSVTYKHVINKLSWGGQGEYVYRIGENANEYTLGNRIEADAWIKWSLNKHSSVSFELAAANWQAIKGKDDNIVSVMNMPMDMGGMTMNMDMLTTPLADPANTGGTRVDSTLGFSGNSRSGAFSFAFGVGMPLYQNLNGLQMRNKLYVSSALNLMF